MREAARLLVLLAACSGTRATAEPTALPRVPPGPTAGDWAQGTWSQPPTLRGLDGVPWLRNATQARLFVLRLPRDEARRRGLLEAAVVHLTARHGRTFEDPTMRQVLAEAPWYVPSAHYSVQRLSEGEREALDLLLDALAAAGQRAEARMPGIDRELRVDDFYARTELA